MNKFLFVRSFEGHLIKKKSNNLDEFKDFCHYASLSDWTKHRKIIEKCLVNGNYVFTGNDVKYFVYNVEEN
jgi:hypothetical protein